MSMKIKGLFNTPKKSDSPSPHDKEMQMQRRLYDYSRVLKLFKTHPYITVKEMSGAPPEKYTIAYNIDGLMQSGKSIEAINKHEVEITFPGKYPNEPPKAAMVTPLFHPNVSPEKMVDLGGIWTQEMDLADCIVKIGELITFKRYSTDEPLNSEAAQWALRNKPLLPLSDVELGYAEIEEKIDDEEQTKAIVIENNTADATIENKNLSNLAVANPGETDKTPDTGNKRAKSTANSAEESQKQEKTKSPFRREDGMFTQKNDQFVNNEPEMEKTFHKPISAQVSVGDDVTESAADDSQRIGTGTAAEKRKTRVYTIENNSEAIPMDARENERNPNMYALARVPKEGPFCPQCGCHVEEYANFCGRCGAKLRVKSSQRVARIFFIIGMIAIPILIFEGGSVIFLLNKKLSARASSSETVEPVKRQLPSVQAPVENDNKQIDAQEPAPIAQKSIARPQKESATETQESRKSVAAKAETPRPVKAEQPRPAPAAAEAPRAVAKAETNKPAPVVAEAPRPSAAKAETHGPAPVAVEAPRPAVVPRVETPRPAPAAPEAPRPAPVAAEAPKPSAAPAVVEAPKPAPAPAATAAPVTESAKRKAAVDGYLSQPEGTQQPAVTTKVPPANQTSVADNLKLARLYMGIGSYDDAIARFREVVKVDPYNQDAIQGLMQAKKMKASTGK